MSTITPAAPFVASGACSSCPHRGTCHEARKRVHDAEHSVGRHYECRFYRGIEARLRPIAFPRWWHLGRFGAR